MKKIIFFAAFVIFLIIVGAVPVLVGISFKHHYLDFIAAVNQKNSLKAKIVLLDYKRGWFNSTATIQITPIIPSSSDVMKRAPMFTPEQLSTLITVTLTQNISHGPIVMDKINNRPAMAMAAIENIFHMSNVESALYGAPKSRGLLEMNSVFNFSDECTNRIIMPPIQYSMPGKGNISWEGLTVDIFFHLTRKNELDQIKTKTKFGALELKDISSSWGGDFTLKPITSHSATVREVAGLWTGDSAIYVSGATLNGTSGLWFNLDNLSFKADATLTKNLYQLSNVLALNKLDVPSWPINTISGFDFKLNFKDLNASELINVIKIIDTKSKVPLTDEFEKQYLQALIRIITPTSNIDIASSSDTSLGKFNLNALLYWPASVALPQTTDDVYKNASAKIDIRMNIVLAKELIKISSGNIAERSARKIAVTPSPSALTVDMTPQADSAKNAFSQYIAGLMRAGKVSLGSSLQIMNWWDQQLPPDAFAAKLKSLGLGFDTESGLVQNYTQLRKAAPTPVPVPAPAQTMPAEVATNQQTQQMQDQMQQLLMSNILVTIDEWLKQGYLIQDGNDYVTSITREAGVIKVNGKDLPPEIANMAAPELSPAPPAAQ